MADAKELIGHAFQSLGNMPGFKERVDQVQLSLLISDCIEGKKSAVFEAPTGLGKSLAALIPALAHAIASGKRTVIATYTNVLAEQYWRKDLPLALSLFEYSIKPKTQFLIGRQRYACRAAMAELPSASTSEFRVSAELGIESEFRDRSRKFGRELSELWQKISAPPVCPGRLCSYYPSCFYYDARRGAQKAGLVITNHSVVLQDALLREASEGEQDMLGEVDFLVLDEAHDLTQAALNALEFELSESKLGLLGNLVQRMQASLATLAFGAGAANLWHDLCDTFRRWLAAEQAELRAHGMEFGDGILRATPLELGDHPQVKLRTREGAVSAAQEFAEEISAMTLEFLKGVDALLRDWHKAGAITGAQVEDANDGIHNYCMYIREFAYGCRRLFSAAEGAYAVGVTYSAFGERRAASLRRDVIGLNEPLRELLWSQVPSASISATLAVDGNFEFYRRMTGAEPDFEEILPTPFDFRSQAAVYLPRAGAVPDPTAARKEGREEDYYDAIAKELSGIIRSLGGRTLGLFHSRKEMEAVHERMAVPSSLPIYMQKGSGAGWVGEKFRSETHASLFALRSFWTGFDAPGETLSCVALVRVPFEVPIDPPQVARLAWFQTLGLDVFASYSLPQAKMLIRQGAGRLIRTDSDRGIIALLDPRVRLKNYGDQILGNLPAGIRHFDEIEDAMAHVGLAAQLA